MTDEDGQASPADQVTVSATAVRTADISALTKEGLLLLVVLLAIAALGFLHHLT